MYYETDFYGGIKAGQYKGGNIAEKRRENQIYEPTFLIYRFVTSNDAMSEHYIGFLSCLWSKKRGGFFENTIEAIKRGKIYCFPSIIDRKSVWYVTHSQQGI
jgi:hypothetical protein